MKALKYFSSMKCLRIHVKYPFKILSTHEETYFMNGEIFFKNGFQVVEYLWLLNGRLVNNFENN